MLQLVTCSGAAMRDDATVFDLVIGKLSYKALAAALLGRYILFLIIKDNLCL